ncbi:hypothetical protein HNQ44_002580 [Planomicrobium koreense]|uniref:DUF7000 domain-containing protein n=1 Tax=Planococcus koreensis TaxID=112331 RepID=A0A7W8CW51_9BACL|nr:hypothetical protein [Planococcus koreensis]MBB5181115.1 hypothetical protein [Planococcus koreensis]
MKGLNQLIHEYTNQLQDGELQAAYKGILAFISKLRIGLIKKYPQNEIGSMYQGHMDMTFFSFKTEQLKDKGLKIAIVYLHEKGAFEVWLSARNRDIAKKYELLQTSDMSADIMVFHDEANLEAIIECTLTSTPDFEDPDSLASVIDQGVNKFVDAVSGHL